MSISKEVLNKVVNDKEYARKILEVNSKLYEEIEILYTKNKLHTINDIIDFFKYSLMDYSIGFYSYNYIRVCNSRITIFTSGLIDSNEVYGFLDEEDKKLVIEVEKLSIELDSMDYEDDEYDAKDEELNKKLNKLIRIVTNKFNNMTTINEDVLIEYFQNEVESGYTVLNDCDAFINDDLEITRYITVSYK